MSQVTWTEEKTSKFVGRVPVYENGQPVMDPKTGQQATERKNEPVTYWAPSIAVKPGDSAMDVAVAFEEILSRSEVGFKTLAEIVEHCNFGFRKELAQQFNQGKDIKYSPAQQNVIRAFKDLLKMGEDVMPLQQLIEGLLRKGIATPYHALGLPDPTENGVVNAEQEASVA